MSSMDAYSLMTMSIQPLFLDNAISKNGFAFSFYTCGTHKPFTFFNLNTNFHSRKRLNNNFARLRSQVELSNGSSPYSNVNHTVFDPINDKSTWYGNHIVKSKSWIHHLTNQHVRELDDALENIKSKEIKIKDITMEDFYLPSLGHILTNEIREEIVHGRGFALLKGLPVGRYSKWESMASFFGIGTYFGNAVSQNKLGHLMGHVRDLGNDPKSPTVRIYTTNAAQPFHTDSCDIVGLLCLRPARKGGLSSVSSSITIFNEMLKVRPDLVQILHEPFLVDRKGEIPEGKLPYYQMPIMNRYRGHLSIIYARGFIEAAQRFPEVPRLTPLQIEALDMMDSLAARADIRLDMNIEPGDVQFLHNHQTVHSRTAYMDEEGEEGKRHLLRLWISPYNGRPLPPVFSERYGSVEIGPNRGGIKCVGVETNVPLDPL